MTWCLIFTCCTTPLFISFHEDEPGIDKWDLINIIVDSLFAIDIVVMFFSAFHDDDFQIIDNLSDIARNYVVGWFLLDLMAITPFDEFQPKKDDLSAGGSSGNMNDLVRIAKLGRMQKLIKLTRLIRIIKIVKQKNSMLK